MDAKMAISYLEDRSGKRISVSLPDQRANEIADLIRRQAKDAEIGRAVRNNLEKCEDLNVYDFPESCEINDCPNIPWCEKLRAERSGEDGKI